MMDSRLKAGNDSCQLPEIKLYSLVMARKKKWYQHRPALSGRAFAPLCGVLVLFYLCFHAISGDRGVVALFQESRKLEQLKIELAKVTAEREALDAKVRGLSSNSLD